MKTTKLMFVNMNYILVFTFVFMAVGYLNILIQHQISQGQAGLEVSNASTAKGFLEILRPSILNYSNQKLNDSALGQMIIGGGYYLIIIPATHISYAISGGLYDLLGYRISSGLWFAAALFIMIALGGCSSLIILNGLYSLWCYIRGKFRRKKSEDV
jgi:hypothetical protein